jgi:general secretion pathway protein H
MPGITRHHDGFTLLEILVVMVIASMMVTLVPPLFSGAVSGARVKASARDLAIAMRESRSRAILSNSEQQLRLDLEQHSYDVGDQRSESLPADMRVGIEQITGAQVHDTKQYTLRFFPDGSTSGELITLKRGARAYLLQLDWLTGKITIQEGQSDAG